MIGIYRKLMMLWCGAVVLFGSVLMGAGFASTDRPTRALFDILSDAAPVFDAPLRFSVGLMGAVTFGWGLSLLAVTSVLHLLDPATARLLWMRLALACGTWYLVDSTISVATGFGLNAVSNTVFMAAFLLIAWRSGVLAPIAAVHRRVFNETSAQ